MAKKLKIWYDKEGDYLEILLSDAPGFMRETSKDYLMERVDEEGNILGYSIMGIHNLKQDKLISTELEFA